MRAQGPEAGLEKGIWIAEGLDQMGGLRWPQIPATGGGGGPASELQVLRPSRKICIFREKSWKPSRCKRMH